MATKAAQWELQLALALPLVLERPFWTSSSWASSCPCNQRLRLLPHSST
jgi:hypothetical protein